MTNSSNEGDLDRQRTWRQRTRLVRGGLARSEFGETCEALFMTSGYRYDDPETAEARFKGEEKGHVYSRLSNPTVEMFERRMALIEGAPVCKATATGMAAVSTALLCFLRAGDHVVAARALFGSCRYIVDEVLPRFGIEVTLVDGCDLKAWRSAVRKGTKACFFETPTNPQLEIIDIAGVVEVAQSVGARVVVDNVFATPLLQRPRDYGADVVVYSATKHIDGQGRCLGGAILCDEAFYQEHLLQFHRHTGPTLSPFNAWLLLKGLETLELRIERHCANAQAVAHFLERQPGIERVIYPGLHTHPHHQLARRQMTLPGNVVSFVMSGGKTVAFNLLRRLQLIDISNNLGDAKSLITHPGTTTHQRLAVEERQNLGIGEGLLRLSVGLEDQADLTEDLGQAIKAAVV